MEKTWIETNRALKELFKILCCSYCTQSLCDNNQFLSCGHLSCLDCLKNEMCLQCKEVSVSENGTIKRIIDACCIIAKAAGFKENIQENVESTSKLNSEKIELNTNNNVKPEVNCKIKKIGRKKKIKRKRAIDNDLKPMCNNTFIIPKNIDKRNHLGETKLQVECKKGHVENVKKLLSANANPNIGCNAGWTPLQEAADFGYLEMAELLLTNGAEVDKPGHLDRTPLQEAVNNNNGCMIDLLLKYKADKNKLNEEGRVSLDKYLKQTKKKLDEISNSSNLKKNSDSEDQKNSLLKKKRQSKISEFIHVQNGNCSTERIDNYYPERKKPKIVNKKEFTVSEKSIPSIRKKQSKNKKSNLPSSEKNEDNNGDNTVQSIQKNEIAKSLTASTTNDVEIICEIINSPKKDDKNDSSSEMKSEIKSQKSVSNDHLVNGGHSFTNLNGINNEKNGINQCSQKSSQFDSQASIDIVNDSQVNNFKAELSSISINDSCLSFESLNSLNDIESDDIDIIDVVN